MRDRFRRQKRRFKKLARDIAMHICALNPQFLKREDIDTHSAELANEMFSKELAGKPEEMKAKILEGKIYLIGASEFYWNNHLLKTRI